MNSGLCSNCHRSAAVGSIADDRHTHRSTAVSNAADGRRTMTHSM